MIQPHMLKNIHDYRSCLINDKVISQIYSFSLSEEEKFSCNAIQDASGDIVFYQRHGDEEQGVMFIGPASSDKTDYVEFKGGCSYVGVRFKPGYPLIINGTNACHLFNQVMPLNDKARNYRILADEAAHHVDSKFPEIRKTVYHYLKNFSDRKQGLCQRLIDYMLSYTGDLRRINLEAEFGYTAYYMNKLFKAYTGYTLKKYFNLLKVHRMLNYYEQQSLVFGGLDYSALALELGYSDQSHMIRNFQSHVGLTPHRFWQQMYEIEVR
mgnify:CR=1 FL=1